MTSHGEIDLESSIFWKNAPSTDHISSHCVLPSPLPGTLIVLLDVSLVQASNLGHQGVIRVGVTQQRAYGQQHLRDCEGRWPLWPQNVQAYSSITVYVWVVDSCGECKFWGLKWVVCWKVDVEEENPSFEGWVWGAKNGCLPVEWVITYRSCWTLSWWIVCNILQFFVDSF